MNKSETKKKSKSMSREVPSKAARTGASSTKAARENRGIKTKTRKETKTRALAGKRARTISQTRARARTKTRTKKRQRRRVEGKRNGEG